MYLRRSWTFFHIASPNFEHMVNQIYPPEVQLSSIDTTDTEIPFLILHLPSVNEFVSSKIYDFDFNMKHFPFWGYDVRTSQARFRYHNFRQIFFKFCRKYFKLISKFNVGIKAPLRTGLSEPDVW